MQSTKVRLSGQQVQIRKISTLLSRYPFNNVSKMMCHTLASPTPPNSIDTHTGTDTVTHTQRHTHINYVDIYIFPDLVGDYFVLQLWTEVNLFQPTVAFHIETSNLIYTVNQMTGFYMKCNTGLKWEFQCSLKIEASFLRSRESNANTRFNVYTQMFSELANWKDFIIS